MIAAHATTPREVETMETTRILTACTVCDATVQTDSDQTPTTSHLFEELVYNLTDENVRTDHEHILIHEEV